jgi:hypothetical protein
MSRTSLKFRKFPTRNWANARAQMIPVERDIFKSMLMKNNVSIIVCVCE